MAYKFVVTPLKQPTMPNLDNIEDTTDTPNQVVFWQQVRHFKTSSLRVFPYYCFTKYRFDVVNYKRCFTSKSLWSELNIIRSLSIYYILETNQHTSILTLYLLETNGDVKI